MSQRSKYSKYSARGKSLVTQRKNEITLENIEEKDEINYDKMQKWYVWENELTKEELSFNNQVVSYKQGKELIDKNYEVTENQDKISEVGRVILENNFKRVENQNALIESTDLFLCAKWMYDLYMSKGIHPQTKTIDMNGSKTRSLSEAKNQKTLTNEELERKIQKDMIIAKHLGGNIQSNEIAKKSSLISAAHKTFGGNSFKPSIIPKLGNLKSNFSEMTGATTLIDQQDPNYAKQFINTVRLELIYI